MKTSTEKEKKLDTALSKLIDLLILAMKWTAASKKWNPWVDFRRKSGSESGRNPACQFFH